MHQEASGCGRILTTDAAALSNTPGGRTLHPRVGTGASDTSFKKKKLYVFGCMKSLLWRQLLWRVGAFVVTHGLCSTEREILVPRPGTGPLSPALQGGV